MTITGIAVITPEDVTVVGAPYAPAGPIVIGTSSSSNTVAIGGTYVWAMNEIGLGFTAGLRVRASVATAPTNWIEGIVSAFDGVNLTVVSDLYAGSGIYSSWNVGIAGQQGQKGDTGATGAVGPQGPPGGAPLDTPLFTGDPRAPTPPTADNDTSIATTAFVKNVVASYQPLDGDLTAIAALTGTNVIYYRSAADTWATVTIGANLTFTGGTLTATTTGAPINNPVFTGDPQAPTPVKADNDTSIATTAHVKLVVADYAPLASPALTGTPTAPTATAGTNTTQLATTAFVTGALTTGYQPLDADLTSLAAASATGAIYYRSGAGTWATVTMGSNMGFAGGVLSSAGGAGGGISEAPNDGVLYGRIALGWQQAVAPSALTAYAQIASPSFTGAPLAPTPITADNSQKIATTAYVQAAITTKADLASPTFTGTPAAPTATAGTNTTQIASTAFVATAITSKANLVSPVFTGDPQAPTPATADNDTSIATTAFVKNQSYASLASPVFTGDPQAPTATSGDNDTSIATTAFVQQAITSPLGVVDGSSAAAGRVGEELFTFRDASNRQGIPGATWVASLGLALSAGEWEISAAGHFHFEGIPTAATQVMVSLGTSNTGPIGDGVLGGPKFWGTLVVSNGYHSGFIMPQIIRLTSSATYNLLVLQNQSTAPVYVEGHIRARRMR